jgi:aldose 1-epimerase
MIRLLQTHEQAQLVLMENDLLRVQLTNFGAAIFSVQLKGSDGTLDDIALTCDSLEEFLENKNFYGATVGRVVNRIKNGRAVIGGKTFQLTINDGNNSAHGGNASFARRFWETEFLEDGVVFTLSSPDGEEGYPGNLNTSVTYRFDEQGRIEITHTATSRQIFVNGAIQAAEFLHNRKPGMYGMSDLLKMNRGG